MSILKSAVIITSVFLTTNTSAQIIEYKNSPLGIKYYTQDGHRIDATEVKLAISKDQNAFLHYDKFTINTSFSLAFGSVGAPSLDGNSRATKTPDQV